jgi:hypothetical protein
MAILFMEGFDHWDITTTGGGYPAPLTTGGIRSHPLKNFGDYMNPDGGFSIGDPPYQYQTIRNPNVAVTSVAKFSDFGRYYQPASNLLKPYSVFNLKNQSTNTIFIQYYAFASENHRNKGFGIPGQILLEYSPVFKTCVLRRWNTTINPLYSVALPSVNWRFESWNFIEIQFVIGMSGGFILRINNQEVASANGIQTQYVFDYTALQGAYYDPDFNTISNPSGPIDHLVIYDNSGDTNNDWLGEAKVATLYPKSDGFYRSFTPQTNLETATVESIPYDPQGRENIDPLTLSNFNGFTISTSTVFRYIVPIPWNVIYMGKSYGLGEVSFVDTGVIFFGNWFFSGVSQGNWTAGEQPIIGSWNPNTPKISLNHSSSATAAQEPSQVYGGLCENCQDGSRKFRLWCGSSGLYNGVERFIEYEVIFYEDEPNRIDVHTKFKNYDGISVVTSNTTNHATFTMEPSSAVKITTSGSSQQNYRMLNDVIFWRNIDSAAYANVSHVYTNIVGSIDTYEFDTIPDYPGLDILAIQTSYSARKDDVGIKRMSSVIVAEGNTAIHVADSQFLGLTDQFYTQIFETNPITETNWTADTINNIELGFKLTD